VPLGQVREHPVQNHKDVRREGHENRTSGITDSFTPHVQQHHHNDNDRPAQHAGAFSGES
jgi:hypothetical protein